MSSESNFSYTTKINNDLLTVRGDSFDEFLKNLIGAASVPAINHLISVLDGTIVSAQADPVAEAVQVVTNSLGATPVDPFGGSFEPVTPPVAAKAGDRTCSHGVMVKRTGATDKGPWRAYMCPTPKGTPDQCKAIFAKRGTAEWDSF